MSTIKANTISNNATTPSTLTIGTTSNHDVVIQRNSVTQLTIGNGTVSTPGNLAFTGTGNRITGDFSNATTTSRVMFQTSTSNGNTVISALPNGTSTQSNFIAYNTNDPANTSIANMRANATDIAFISTSTGTGVQLPLGLYIGATKRFDISTAGLCTAYNGLDVIGALKSTGTSAGISVNRDGSNSVTGGAYFRLANAAEDRVWVNQLNASNGLDWHTYQGATWATAMTLNAVGNLGLGVTPKAWQYKAIEIGFGGNAIFTSGATQMDYITNAYYDGTWKYATTGSSTNYNADSGSHIFKRAVGGTPDAALTWKTVAKMYEETNFPVLEIGSSSYAAGGYSPTAILKFNNGSAANHAFIKGHIGANSNEAYLTFGETIGGVSTTHMTLNQDGILSIAYQGMYIGDSQYMMKVVGGKLQMINTTNGVELGANATTWATISDETQKDIIEPITGAVERISTWRTVIGKLKTDTEGTRRPFLIAQDILANRPEAVDASEEILKLRYTETIPDIIAAIKELTARLAALENK